MNLIKKLTGAVALSVVLAGSAFAEVLVLSNGTRLEGKATAYDSDTETLSWQLESGQARDVKLSEMRPSTAYRVLKGQVPKTSGAGQLQLANFARDIEYFAHSVRHYEYALKADPSLQPKVDAEIEILKSRAATWGMAQAQAEIAKKNLHKAEEWLTKIITKVPDTPEAKQAQAMLDEYYGKVRAQRTADADRKHEETLQKGLAGAKKAYDDMLAANKKALTDEKAGSKAVKSWEAAIKHGERASRDLEKFEKKNPTGYEDLLPTYNKAVNDQLVEINLNLSTHWATRNSYNKALGYANKALAIDPQSEQAMSLRNRIIDASSRGARWIW